MSRYTISPWVAAFAVLLYSAYTEAANPSCIAPQYAKVRPPAYPPSAVAKHVSGTTTLRVVVGVDGTPRRISVEKSSGSSDLDSAAVDQVALWLFKPSQCSGKTVEAQVFVPVEFKLTQQVLNAVWKVSPDLERMEAPTAGAEIDYLDQRSDVEKKHSGHNKLFFDEKGQTVWEAVHSADGWIAVMRVRLESGPNLYEGLYSSLCDGPAWWCSRTSDLQVAHLQAFPIPPPPIESTSGQ